MSDDYENATEDRIPENRVAILELPQDFLRAVLEGRFELRGFPDDAKIVGVNANWEWRSIEIMVESQTFEPVPQGMRCPRIGRFGRFEKFGERIESVTEPDGTQRHYRVSEHAERIEIPDGKVKFREFL